MRETVLYFAPDGTSHTPLLKGVLAQMNIKVKNLTPERCAQRIGWLTGVEGVEKRELSENFQRYAPVLDEELMVMAGFTDGRLDELLENLKKAGVPKIRLKAIVTETNARWTVYQLYDQLKAESARI